MDFSSPYEFVWHAAWLMRGLPRLVREDGEEYPDCMCKICMGLAHQQPITDQLFAISRMCDGEGNVSMDAREDETEEEDDEEDPGDGANVAITFAIGEE